MSRIYIIYKIISLDKNVDYCYVGSTQNLTKRKYQHKHSCKVINDAHNKKLYETINNNGGWNNWEMKPIEEYVCDTPLQARIREQYHIDLIEGNKLNKNNAFISKEQAKINKNNNDKEYYKNISKDKKADYQKKYREANKDHKIEYNLKNKESITEQKKQYYSKHKDSISENQKKYRIINRDSISENQKKYRIINRDIILEKQKQYYSINKDQITAYYKTKYIFNKQAKIMRDILLEPDQDQTNNYKKVITYIPFSL
jgi:hypothetical protein